MPSGLQIVLRCLAWCALVGPATAVHETTKFIIVSAPRLSKVSYVKVGRFGDTSQSVVHDLVDFGGHPQGLAVDQVRSRLYVADPDSKRIVGYRIRCVGADGLAADMPRDVAQSAEARWVGVDSVGNIFFSDEGSNKIYRVSGERVMRGSSAGKAPQLVYDGSLVSGVHSPGGIALDNFFVYWTNKGLGEQVGSVLKGSQSHDQASLASSAKVLARNTHKSYGVCLAFDNLFFTDAEHNLYGVKKSGLESAVTVSNKLSKPRGCAWDGDGTVYVADRGANKVWSFASNMKAINTVQMDPAFDLDDAFGIAVFVRQ